MSLENGKVVKERVNCYVERQKEEVCLCFDNISG